MPEIVKKRRFHRFAKFILPRLNSGGLEISDTALVFVRLNERTGAWERASVRLEPGIVEKGKLLQPARLRQQLRALHTSATRRKHEVIPVVLSIPDSNVYTQRISLPPLKKSEFREAVKLNIQATSPIEIGQMYYDWERVASAQENTSGEQGILASYAERAAVDGFLQACGEEYFFVTAVEQKTTSFTRVVRRFEGTFDTAGSCLLILATTDGISSIIVRQGSVHFVRFTPWESIAEEEFRDFIVRDYHQMNNFLTNQFHEKFSCVHISAYNGAEQIVKIFAETFSVPSQIVQVPGMEGPWHIALGAALRGLIPRSQDVQISLAPDGTESLYQQIRLSAFLSLWTLICSAAGGTLLLAFLGIFIFLNGYIGTTAATVSSAFNDQQVLAQYGFYSQEAQKFNSEVLQALELASQHVAWNALVAQIYGRAGTGIVIDRIYVQSRDMPVTVNGRAISESAANEFRNSMAQLPYVAGAELPLGSLQRINETELSFQLTFRLKNVQF
jgi:hypothetical protein